MVCGAQHLTRDIFGRALSSVNIMLAKANRLIKDKEFNRVFNPPAGGGKANYDKIVGIRVIKNNLEINRFGILISVKVSKKSVIRNKIKRQIRGVIRLEMDKLRSGCDFVIICLPEIAGKKYEEIEKSIKRHFKKLAAYK